MNEKQKLFITGGIILALIAIIALMAINASKAGEKILKSVDEAIQSEEGKAILIIREGCAWCGYYDPEIDYVKEKYGVDLLTVDTAKLSSGQREELLKKVNVDSAEFGTPHMTYVKGNEIVSHLAGYNTIGGLVSYLKTCGLIAEDVTTPINYINYEQYKNLIASNENQILVVGQPGCPYCTAAIPVLDSIAEKYKVQINYLSTVEIGNNGTEFESSLTYFQENEWGTPLMIIVKDNKVVADFANVATEENYVTFLKENGFIVE